MNTLNTYRRRPCFALSNGTIPDPYGLPFTKIGGSHPTQNSNRYYLGSGLSGGADNAGVENAAVEISARNIEKMKEMKMQEWKHRHGPVGDENAEVEISGVGLNEIALSD